MTPATRDIRIAGGGLAGLSLGIALRRAGVPVTVFEAGNYPRHKVCGEFIAGLAPETAAALGISEDLADAQRNGAVTWFRAGRAFRRDRLPSPALGISRRRLDQRLAERFRALGGDLRTGERAPESARETEGWVWAVGRRRGAAGWIGLKIHCIGLELASDLEVHLSSGAYVGAARIEDGRVNVCGLFRSPSIARGGREEALIRCLDSSGLGALAKRLRASELDTSSAAAVAGLAFGAAAPERACIQIGDAHALIPPFTGDGMAMAFESAAAAAGPLASYASGACSWAEARQRVRESLASRFRVRLAAARIVHPFLYRGSGVAAFRAASAARLLPFRPMFGLLH